MSEDAGAQIEPAAEPMGRFISSISTTMEAPKDFDAIATCSVALLAGTVRVSVAIVMAPQEPGSTGETWCA